MLQELACTHDRVIGTKQTQRSLERGVAQAVYLANDADERIVKKLKAMCEEKDVPVHMVQSMVCLLYTSSSAAPRVQCWPTSVD